MKYTRVVFKAALLLTVLASLAACKGGVFVDPGHGGGEYTAGGGGGGGGGGGLTKPAILDNNATYQEAADKLDDIIEYCEAHPGNQNNSVKLSVETMKKNFSAYNVSGNWNTAALVNISAINGYISMLQ
jgi:hypothetical protein